MNVKPKQKHNSDKMHIAPTSSQPCIKPNVVRSPKSTYVCPYSDLPIGILEKDGSIKPTSFLYKNIHEFLRQRSLGLVDT